MLCSSPYLRTCKKIGVPVWGCNILVTVLKPVNFGTPTQPWNCVQGFPKINVVRLHIYNLGS